MSELPNDYLDAFDFGFTLRPAHTALLVIDMQYASASRTAGLGRKLAADGRAELGRYRFDRIETVCIPAIRRLLRFFRDGGLRVVYVTIGSNCPDFGDMPPNLRKVARAHNNRAGQPEHGILDEIAPQPGEIVVNKTTTGAFASTGLDSTLRTMGIGDLLLCGVSTDQCVESTARAAADLGYNCVIVEDGCASASPVRHDATLRAFQRMLGRVATSEAVLRELAREAAAPGGARRG